MKSVLLNTTVVGTGMYIPRKPNLILGDSGKYPYGDILDANAVDEEIKSAIGNVVDAAPEALDTLKEIAESLHNDSDLAGTLIAQITALDTKVDNNNQNQTTALNNAVTTINAALNLKADLVEGVVPYAQLPESIWKWNE